MKNEQLPRSVSPERVIHPSALGLIANQAMKSGGKLTRRGVVVNKGLKSVHTTPSPNRSKGQQVSPKRNGATMVVNAMQTGQTSLQSESSKSIEQQVAYLETATVQKSGEPLMKPVTS